jgi:hypothetical protein
VPHANTGLVSNQSQMQPTQRRCLVTDIPLIYAESREPTSGLEPLTCSLRVCGQWLLVVTRVCKSRIGKRTFVPSIARYCSVMRPG